MTSTSLPTAFASLGQTDRIGGVLRPQGAAAGEGADFASVLAQFAGEAVQTVRAGEMTAAAGITGTVPVQKVAEAVMAAEQTLQTAIVLRDKVVAAYLELSRMAI